MKFMLEVCLVTFAITCLARAQAKPALQPGVRVEMPVAAHAVEMPGADNEHATVVTLTADGTLFIGAEPVESGALSTLSSGIVYVKADAQIEYQKILTILDALRGRTVVLLTAAPVPAEKAKLLPPYGVKLTIAAR